MFQDCLYTLLLVSLKGQQEKINSQLLSPVRKRSSFIQQKLRATFLLILDPMCLVKQDVSHFESKINEKYIQTAFVAIALRIAITSDYISFYSTGVKSAAFCIIDMRMFKLRLM